MPYLKMFQKQKFQIKSRCYDYVRNKLQKAAPDNLRKLYSRQSRDEFLCRVYNSSPLKGRAKAWMKLVRDPQQQQNYENHLR